MAPILMVSVLVSAWLVRAKPLSPSSRRWLSISWATGLAAAPFFLPAGNLAGRVVAAGIAVSLAAKLRLLLDREQVDPAMIATVPRFALWLLMPPATTWPRSAQDARRVRKLALRRLGRAGIKAALMFTVLVVKARHPGAPDVLATALTMLEFYSALSGLADLLAAGYMLLGIHSDETFNAPYAARSSGDFWGRRWNRFISRFGARYLFLPLARGTGAAVAIFAVFAASGLMHEYIVVASVGWDRYVPGLMLAFFVAHGLFVMAETRWLSRGRTRATTGALGAAVNLVWLTATAPLFFKPMAPVVAAFEETWLRLIPALR